MSDISLPARPSGPEAISVVWIAAFVVAALLHGGAFGAMWWKANSVDEADALGAPAVEINVDLAAPREAAEALPLGPQADESAASAAAVEQHEKVEKIEAPKEQPKEAENAERVVAPEVLKETKATPSKVETKAQAASDSIASEAAAPPKIESAKDAPISAAPEQGLGVADQKIRTTWQKSLVAHLNRFKRYPHGGDRQLVEVTLSFTLDRLGHVVNSSVEKSSGDAAFDQAALDMMRRADPVPPPPPLVADDSLSFSLPVVFKQRR